MKKKNNPFKMWGSYVGAGILAFSNSFNKISMCVQGLNFSNAICSIKTTFSEFGFISGLRSIPYQFVTNIFKLSELSEILAFPILLILGFLIGWGIEVLLRKNKWFGLK